jgi:hypothetical protein
MFNYNKIENELNILQIKNNNIIQQPQKSNLGIDNLFFKKENNDKKSVFSNKSMFSFLPSNKLKKYLVNDSENNNNNIENNEIKKKEMNKSVNLEITNSNSNFEKKIETKKDYSKIYDNFVKENTIVKLLLKRDLEGLKNAIKGKIIYIIFI